MPELSSKWTKVKLVVKAVHIFQRSRAYKKEGDPTWDEPENVVRRKALLQRPQVRGIIERFWGILDMWKDGDGNLLRQSYLDLNTKLQKALLVDFEAEEARECAAADWDADASKND